ncbi:PREDICTED: uncharacterized protein LOC109219169 [Nicotiana attenuata]|uniref:Duf1262 family protein n=1 Tax=Nicotiana attenuata TaxID=49451 RepID=A0A1J6KPZ7_NICAT|nr:PREDICTED: uncharacterized protein LOC109219169 [Nicotiana attenuata]OIT21241.1 hypothetical protein A4A49_35814 [Nicotiana attenuata]
MYVTRPLSYYQQNPEALSLPPDGPNSGYLVVQDEESETYCCFGLCKNRDLMDLPFPQNKNLTVRYETSDGEHKIILKEDVMFIPVLNKPLSSNQYFAIKPHGKSKGKAFVCSKEEDKQNCCFCRCIRDVRPKPLDPDEVYQQYEICLYVTSCSAKGSFFAKSLAPDGFPPRFLRRKGWHLCAKTPKNYELSDDALGLNAELRQQLPELNLTPSCKSSEAVVVGKWYCPFMFIKDGTVKVQMERSMFYEMTLEQKWEPFFTCQNDYKNEGNSVLVDVVLDTEIVLIAESKAKWDETNVVEGVIWFRSYGKNGKEIPSVGLRQEIVQRMKWEQERGGWQNQGRIKQVQQYRENGSKWKKFSFYVLIERFVLRRMDKSVVMTYDFKHIDKLKSIWE